MAHSDDTKKQVWDKATIVAGYDETLYRKDAAGAWIKYDDYVENDGSEPEIESAYAWVIDHIFPKSVLTKLDVPVSDMDHIDNLRPLNRQNDISKGDSFPDYKAVITSEENRNVACELYLTVNEDVRQLLEKKYNL